MENHRDIEAHSPRTDERSPLLDHADIVKKSSTTQPPTPASPSEQPSSSAADTKGVASIVAVLLIAVFVANADISLVLATRGIIGSDFKSLEYSSWLFTGSLLATCAVQPLYAKLSDVFGRRDVLLASYFFFIVGSLMSGIGTSMRQVVAGRVISGIGGGGMTSLVTIIITDLVSLRDVAVWRSYVNVMATTGRSLGGPLGGFLADRVGWRWSFLVECPVMILASLLCFWLLPGPKQHENKDAAEDTKSSRLSRIDFAGAAILGLGVLAFLLPLELGGQELPWSHPAIIGLLVAGVVTMCVFFPFEAYCTKDPVFPPRLLRNRNVAFTYLIMFLQSSAQLGLMYTVPPYFQISAKANATSAGTHLVPAFVGNVCGGLAGGFIVKRTGRYRILAILAAAIATASYVLIIFRWRGHTNAWESLYIFPGGFGQGLASSALFVALAVAVKPADMAVSTSGLYLSMNVATVAGVSLVSAVTQNTLRYSLQDELADVGTKDEIVRNVLRDVNFAATLQGHERHAVVMAYVRGFQNGHVVSAVCSALATMAGFAIKDRRF